MPPLAIGAAIGAVAGSSVILGTAATATTIIGAAGIGAMIGSSIGQSQEAKAAQKAAEKKAKAAAAAGALAYQDLTENQMKLSLVTSQTQNIVDAINATSQPGPVYTLPSAQPTDPFVRINLAIDDFLKGRT